MKAEEQLEKLLLRWEELREAGQEVSVAELCRDSPNLAEELQHRIDALRELDWLQSLRQPRGLPSAMRSTVSFLAPGMELVPGYRLVRQLGRGGFGEVWQANAPDGTPVALKVVPWADHAAVLEWRALDTLKEVRHENVLVTLGAWRTDSFLVIAMELAEKTLLDRWQEAHQQGSEGIPAEELLDYFHQAAQGIDHLNAIGVQHRDVKPQNLLLVDGRVKVADFGLARVLAHSVTGHTGSLTLAYAAPEFFDGQTTRYSDQYSLAVSYCQLRGGRLPFTGSAAQMVAAHLHRPPDLSMLPPEERAAVSRALAKRPGARWSSCQEFVAAVARRCPPPARFGGWLSRVAVLGGLVLVLLLLLVALPSYLSRGGMPHVDLPPVRRFETPEGQGSMRSVAAGWVRAPLDRLVAFSNGARPTLWDVETGKVLRHLPGNGGPCAALAPFGEPMGLTGDDDGHVVLWNLADGQEVCRFQGHTASVSSVAFSPDGRQILSGSCDDTVRLWDRPSGQELRCLRGHKGIVMSVAFGPKGRLALSGGWDGTVRLWNLDSGEQLKLFEGHTSRVLSVAFSVDGRYGVSGGLDRTARLWNLETGQEVQRFEGHSEGVTGVAFWDHQRILSVGDQTARIWDLESGQELFRSPEMPSPAESACGGAGGVLIGTAVHGLWLWRLPAEE
jgi:hypothetical protein